MSRLKLHSWNVNGLRSVSEKGFACYLREFNPDILCLQETRISPVLAESVEGVSSFGFRHWHSAEKVGYSGTALLSKVKPLSVLLGIEGDDSREGRVVSAEFSGVWVVCAYVPNSQRELARLPHRLVWDSAFRAHLNGLRRSKPVLVCGDFNCAHTEMDLANPRQNRGNAGFSDQERASFSELLESGYEDTFRAMHPDLSGAYSWWTYRMGARSRNIGWRLDYWLADGRLAGLWDSPAIHASTCGSDHCPVSLSLDASLFA